jgi:hypothetical protein
MHNKKGKEVTNHSEDKYWSLTRFEWIMAVLTLVGVVIATLTGFILSNQLHEMKTDQRAWVTMSLGSVQFPSNISDISRVQVRAPLTVNNVGKTAARNLHSKVIMEYEVNGQYSDFVYDHRIRAESTSGIMFPTVQQTMPIFFVEGNPNDKNGSQPRFLTASEYQDLIKGDGYMVVYGETTYTDIFGTNHWMHYCTFFVSPQAVSVTVTAKGCTDYNDTDGD